MKISTFSFSIASRFKIYYFGGLYILLKNDLGQIIIKCINENNGKATILEVSKYIWINHEDELRKSGDLFYTWQYDFRWQAAKLKEQNILKKTKFSQSRYWEIV